MGRCVSCGHPVPGRRQTCSPRCRVKQWRRARAQAHDTTIARLQGEVARSQAEVAALRQRVRELEHQLGQLKTKLWSTR
jgi:polyhydroxyalkanoate synthesis regulator phasin